MKAVQGSSPSFRKWELESDLRQKRPSAANPSRTFMSRDPNYPEWKLQAPGSRTSLMNFWFLQCLVPARAKAFAFVMPPSFDPRKVIEFRPRSRICESSELKWTSFPMDYLCMAASG